MGPVPAVACRSPRWLQYLESELPTPLHHLHTFSGERGPTRFVWLFAFLGGDFFGNFSVSQESRDRRKEKGKKIKIK